MKISKLQIGILIFFAVVFIAMVCMVSVFKRKLIQHHNISVAKVTDCSYGGRGHVGTITFLYIFQFNDKEIEGSKTFNSDELNFSDAKSFFLNRTFPVIYDSSSPNINFLLIRPADFEKFHYTFPDSLKWVIKYVNFK